MTPDEALAAAWTYVAPGRTLDLPYPRGFWPDLALVAMAMFSQQTINPILDFRPTRCERGSYPEPASTQTGSRKSGGKISAAEKAENTRRLLAMLAASAADKGA